MEASQLLGCKLVLWSVLAVFEEDAFWYVTGCMRSWGLPPLSFRLVADLLWARSLLAVTRFTEHVTTERRS